MRVAVIIPAAGLGTRMSRVTADAIGTGRKQFLLLHGAPVIVHTLRKFDVVPCVDEIIVALRPEDIPWVRELFQKEGFKKPIRLVEGGDTRQDSVARALDTLSPDVDLVAVHDAVRPFVTPELIEKVITEAAQSGAAILGIVPVDTVKEVHKNKIRATLPRENLILTQTPQVFRYELLKRAFDKARADNFIGTDESSLVERLEEVEVTVVPGSERNIKITRPSDLELARLMLTLESTEHSLQL